MIITVGVVIVVIIVVVVVILDRKCCRCCCRCYLMRWFIILNSSMGTIRINHGICIGCCSLLLKWCRKVVRLKFVSMCGKNGHGIGIIIIISGGIVCSGW